MSYSFRQTGECVKEKTCISISDCLVFRLNEIHESEIISAGLSQLPIPSPGQAPPPMFLFLLFWKHQCPRNSGSPPRPAAASDLDIPSFLQGHGTCCILGFLLYKMGRASNFVFSTVPMTPSASFWLMGTFFLQTLALTSSLLLRFGGLEFNVIPRLQLQSFCYMTDQTVCGIIAAF